MGDPEFSPEAGRGHFWEQRVLGTASGGLFVYTEVWAVCRQIGHSSAEKEALRQGEGQRRPQAPAAEATGSSPLGLPSFLGGLGRGEEENGKLLKSTRVENSKRLSYV